MEKTHPNADRLLKVGETAPDFALKNTDGVVYSLAEETAVRPAVLIFYRGDW